MAVDIISISQEGPCVVSQTKRVRVYPMGLLMDHLYEDTQDTSESPE